MFDDRAPIYLQIAERLRDDIVRGDLEADAPVMSTNQFATHLRINPATAAKGLQMLVDQGVLYKRRGIGMFVAPGARDQLLNERRARFFDEIVDPMVEEARAIGVDLDDVVAHLRAAHPGDTTPPPTPSQE